MLSASSTPPPEVLAALPIFPLPNVVLLPGMVLPLNVFEPRYLELVDHVLADGHHIGVPLLRPRSERTADRRPAIEPVFGLGKLTFHVRLPDGRRLIRLEGLGRVRVVRELAMEHLYRQVEVVALPEPTVADRTAYSVLQAQVEQIAQLWGEDGETLRSLLALPDPRIFLYALTAFLPSLEMLAGHDVAAETSRRALIDQQQRSLAADDADGRVAYLTERTAAVLTGLAPQPAASGLLN